MYEPLEIVECMILQKLIQISWIIEQYWSSPHQFPPSMKLSSKENKILESLQHHVLCWFTEKH